MSMRLLAALLIVFTWTALALSAEPSAEPVAPLILPADQTVVAGEGFVTVEAKVEDAKTQVRFLAVGYFADPDAKFKFVTLDRAVIVSVPHSAGTITVFAVASVDGTLSEFVSTRITVEAPKGATAAPTTAAPSDLGSRGPLAISLIADVKTLTPAQAALWNSPTLRPALQKAGHKLYLLDTTRDAGVLTSQKLLPLAQAAGGPALVVQDASGKVLPGGKALPLPTTEAELLTFLGVKP